MTIPHRVSFEATCALIDALAVIDEYGADIIEYNRNESNVGRDKYNSLRSREISSPVTFAMKAYPIIYNPTQRQIEKAGIKTNVECIVTTAMKAWTDGSLSFEKIEQERDTVTLRGQKYIIKEKALLNQFADTFLHINLGLIKL